MASAFQCDRCLRFEEGSPVGTISTTMPNPEAAAGSSASKTIQRQWCANCIADFNEFDNDIRSDPDKLKATLRKQPGA